MAAGDEWAQRARRGTRRVSKDRDRRWPLDLVNDSYDRGGSVRPFGPGLAGSGDVSPWNRPGKAVA
ncbi:hypothetical protein GCM10011354_25050 [Egicoccus halophilus]|uniref:Uncharacterized protein n=1 Tax=Egicoccus halophilus TaxID=1670830 RepID=A0A8J3EUQ0_9ACTN|nr:hypothetical protein GCM10011354_25050 [Egicoccus halophilus]